MSRICKHKYLLEIIHILIKFFSPIIDVVFLGDFPNSMLFEAMIFLLDFPSNKSDVNMQLTLMGNMYWSTGYSQIQRKFQPLL